MSKKLIILSWGFYMSIFVLGCTTRMTPLEDHEPKSPREAKIKNTLISLEEVRNKGDLQIALAFIHNQVRFQNGCRNLVMVPKKGNR